MIIYPYIALRGGRCVNLLRGRIDEPVEYDADPVETARAFAQAGAEWLHVVDLLVGVPVLVGQGTVAGYSDNGREPQKSVLKPGGQVNRTHGLGHAYPRPVGGPGITIGHVRRRLFSMGDYALNAQLLHLHHDFPCDDWDQKGMSNPVPLHCLRNKPASGHPGHGVSSVCGAKAH